MVLVVGESLVDVVERADGSRTEHAGGSPANVAVGLGRLGIKPTLATTLAHDEHGALVRMHLAESGVRLLPGLNELDRTSTAVATIDSDGSADYAFDLTWDPGRIWAEEVPEIVHTGSIAAFLGPGADDVEDTLRRLAPMCIVTFDPNIRPSLLPDHGAATERMRALLALADLVKVSDDDLAWLAPDADPADTARSWLDAGPAAVVVTMGARGARTFTRRGSVASRTRATRVVDTVGAGDAFMAGLIAALTDEDVTGLTGSSDLREADLSLWRRTSELASWCSAITVGRAGAQPPWRAELDAALTTGAVAAARP